MGKDKKNKPDWTAPEDIVLSRVKTTVCHRVDHDLLMWITDEAARVDIKRTNLIESILSDYRKWVEQKRVKRS